MSLPPEVLALLGDDATPEEVAASFERVSSEYGALAEVHKSPEFAALCLESAIAAAAIRECEASRKREAAQIACDVAMFSADPEGMNRLAAARDAAAKDEYLAVEAYDALRNWRKP